MNVICYVNNHRWKVDSTPSTKCESDWSANYPTN